MIPSSFSYSSGDLLGGLEFLKAARCEVPCLGTAWQGPHLLFGGFRCLFVRRFPDTRGREPDSQRTPRNTFLLRPPPLRRFPFVCPSQTSKCCSFLFAALQARPLKGQGLEWERAAGARGSGAAPASPTFNIHLSSFTHPFGVHS